MLRIIGYLSVCGIFLGLNLQGLAAEPGATQPASKKLDLTFVPSDAVAAAVVHPQRLIKSPQFEMWPTEIISAGGKKEWGFDPLQIELAIGVAGMPQNGAPPAGAAAPAGPPQPHFGAVLRFNQAQQDVVRVLQLVVKNGHDGVINGKPARLAAQPMEPSATFIDDRTMILGPEDSINWIVSAKGGDSPLRKQMTAADDSPDAVLFVALEPLRPMLIPMVAMGAMQLPPQFSELTRVPTLTDSIELRVTNLNQAAAAIELDLTAKDATTAADLQRLLQQSLENGKAMFIAQMTEQSARNPNDREMNDAMLHYMNRMGDKVVTALKPKVDGNHVLVRTDLQGGAAEIGVLTALLLPATQAARAAAQRNMSQNDLKQIALCMLNYEDQNHVLPPRAYFDKEGKPLLSWRVMMLPYIEEGNLYQQFHFDEPWDSEHNKELIEKMPEAYKDPRFDLPAGMTIYQAVVGKGCVFDGDKGIKLAQITDGTSKTAGVVAVSPKKAVPWTKPEDWEFDPKNPLRDLDNPSPGGIIQMMFMDGHIEGISPDIDPKIPKAIFTRNGGEAVQIP